MKISELWKAAFLRLGATDESANNMIVWMKGMAKDAKTFEQWDSSMPPPVAKAMIQGMNGPSGAETAASIIAMFRDSMMSHYGISEKEVDQHLRSMGLN